MSKTKYEVGSRNVLKDLGTPNAEEHIVKAQLVYKINMILKDRGLKQVEAGKTTAPPAIVQDARLKNSRRPRIEAMRASSSLT